MREAPLFVGAYDLYSWLLERLERAAAYPELRSAVLMHSRGLLEKVTLALCRFDREERLIQADEHAALLRAHLRLAAEKGLLEDRQLLHANHLLSEVGRQIGGWRKKLDELA